MANLYITEQGAALRKTGDRLLVEKDEEIILDVPCDKGEDIKRVQPPEDVLLQPPGHQPRTPDGRHAVRLGNHRGRRRYQYAYGHRGKRRPCLLRRLREDDSGEIHLSRKEETPRSRSGPRASLLRAFP